MPLPIEPSSGRPTPVWHLYVPKLYTTLRQGYSIADFRHDAIAGLTVAIVALPLARHAGQTRILEVASYRKSLED